MSPTFRRRLRSGQVIFFRASWHLFCPLQHTREYPLLSPDLISLVISALLSLSGLWPSDRSFGGASRRLFFSKFSLILRIFWSPRKDCFNIASDVPGSLFPAFCCYRLYTKEGFFRMIPFSPAESFLRSRRFLMFCEEEWKNSGNRIIC